MLIVSLGIHRLATGRLPEHWEYWMWGMIALSIVVDVYMEICNEIHESTDEISKRLDGLEAEVKGELKAIQRELRAIQEAMKR